MRSEPTLAAAGRCPACGELGLASLEHTPTVYALNELEGSDGNPSRLGRAGKLVVLATVVTVVAGLAALFVRELGIAPAVFALSPIALVCVSLLSPLAKGMFSARRSRPRRWRLPDFGRQLARPRRLVRGTAEQRSGLIRAPLSGRPCLAYEVGVRDDARVNASRSSWRLLEQDNVEFRVGDIEVARGEALLRLPRELSSAGMLTGSDDSTRRFMRMRGILEIENVCIYETVLEPGDACRVGQRGGWVTQIFA